LSRHTANIGEKKDNLRLAERLRVDKINRDLDGDPLE
jgi:hypothetical protein